MILAARAALAVAFAVSCALGCQVDTDPPAEMGHRAGSGGAGAVGGGGHGALGGASTAGASGSSAAGRGGSAGAGTGGLATGGSGGNAGGLGGSGGQAGTAGATSGSSGAGGSGTGGDGEGGHADGAAGASDAAGASGAGGAAGSSCANPTTTIDTSNLTVEEAVETYTFTGSTAYEMRQSINANRDGDYDAFTSWYLSWRYSNDACDGSGLVVLVEIAYSLPEWDEPPAADPALIDEWSTYTDALLCHEYGHAKFGLDAANDVYTALSAIDAGGDCAAQQSLADAAFDGIIDDYAAREIEYDEETNHGATMGAIFPQP